MLAILKLCFRYSSDVEGVETSVKVSQLLLDLPRVAGFVFQKQILCVSLRVVLPIVIEH